MREPIIDDHAQLAPYSTFRLGGPCRQLIQCSLSETLTHVLRNLIQAATPYVLIGGGSNVLIADAGVDAVVVRYFSDDPLLALDGEHVEVTGSTILDHLVRAAVAAGLDGVTNCSGIPGTVGGAIVGNAGAFGKQIGDVVEWVEILDTSGAVRKVSGLELRFAYRASRLQETGEVVLRTRLRLTPSDVAALQAKRNELLALRQGKHPDWRTEPCIGSIFRNIEPTSAAGRRQAAGWFLEEAGAKSLRVGGAYVYPKHANIVINGDGGTASDVSRLIDRMAAAVQEKFGFALKREVRFLGRVEQSDVAGGLFY